MVISRLDCRLMRYGREERLRLTLVAASDAEVLRLEGLAALRRRRAVRLAVEAASQGVPLGHHELAGLLFTSVSTLKRDLRIIESEGVAVPLRLKRNGNGGGVDA
jgi:hypothetical protein